MKKKKIVNCMSRLNTNFDVKIKINVRAHCKK